MKVFKKQRRFITLVEMMIVMFLIAMITGVIAYNYTGSLEEGKAFKTSAGIEKIKTILALAAAEGDLDEVKDNWEKIIAESPLVQNPKDLLKDGWGGPYKVTIEEDQDRGGKILVVSSDKYDAFNKKKTAGASLFSKEK